MQAYGGYLRGICLLAGYLLGGFLTAEAVARSLTGKSARALGTGNPGMANITAQLGKAAGFAVVFQPTGIVFAQLLVNLPFAIRMARTALEDVNPRMEFVARTLGASRWEVFRTVILPLCRNSLISTFVLTWARGMGEFGATLMLVGVTRMKTETLPGSIYLSISTGNYDTAMATAIIMLVVSACTLAIANILSRPSAQSRSSR